MGIFDYRRNYKPFEYPEVTDFTDAINKSFWVHSEVDFTADTQDFLSHLSEPEKNAVKNALLAIAQIEVNVKTFWGDLYTHLPKPEFNGLGSTFAECEFRHSEAYSRLLEVLGYNDEFENLIDIPIITMINTDNSFFQHKGFPLLYDGRQSGFGISHFLCSLTNWSRCVNSTMICLMNIS